jgi:hypothetical protein
MSSNIYIENLWQELEATWELCALVNDFPESTRTDLVKLWVECFAKHPLVDAELSQHEPSTDINEFKIFCKNKYGIHLNDEMKMWVPFRHGDIDYGRFKPE